MFNVSWGWLYTHSRWSMSRHHTHDGRLICWSSFTGAVNLMLHGQCVTQVARGDIVIIIDWCLCDFLVLKHIDEVYALHLHLSLTDVTIFLCCKCSRISILFLTIYWCWLFFMCKLFSSFSTNVYMIFLYWNILIECTHFIFIVIYWCWHIFVLKMCYNFNSFWLFTDVDYFSCAKCSYHSRLMSMWFSCTETHRWSVCTSSLFVIYWC